MTITLPPPPIWLHQVIIRNVTQADLIALEWEGEFQHFRRMYADIYEHARKGTSVLWLAELPEKGVIGQVFIQLNSNRPELADGVIRAYLYGFRIKPVYRGRGLGTQMMDIVEKDLVKRGFHYVTLNVGRDNPDARRLYERLGYTVIAAEPGIWSYIDDRGERRDVNEPAWRMQKQLRTT
jgi:ribosomal protein S18 acetylase RimI-like enzyme